MAHQVDQPGRPWLVTDWESGYPWPEWTNGGIWELRQGHDFEEELETFRYRCYRIARTNDMTVRTRTQIGADGMAILWVQFRPKGQVPPA